MVKKIVMTSLVSAMSLCAFSKLAYAENSIPTATSDWHQGKTYVGATAGIGLSSYSNNYNINALFGYGKTVLNDKLYLGAEVSAGVNYAKYHNHYYWGSSHETTYNLGASFIPGVMLSPTLLAYTRFGLNTTHNHYTVTSATVGVGLQKDLTKKLSLRGEYNTTSYDHKGQVNLGMIYKLD